jgi:ubiquinol-cytochrome c reductase cytochrome b subunit
MRRAIAAVWRWADTRLALSNIFRATLTEYMVPANLNFWHTLGFVLVACFAIQVITGMLLLMYYVPDTSRAFESVQFINNSVPYGWLVRSIHAMASHLFVLAIFLHIASTLWMRAYRNPRELQWLTGMVLLGLVLAAGLSGYLLPWSQLSYWATTVATNSAGSIPYIGDDLVQWVRGTPNVSQFTLGRFFAAHVSIIPFAILACIGVHLLFLRLTGISVPGGEDKKTVRKVPFFPHMVVKEIGSVFGFLILLNVLIFYFPQINFPEDALIPANPIDTPEHIKPHWYFLANYQFLKIVPSEFLGVVLQLLAGLVLFVLPFIDTAKKRPRAYDIAFYTIVTLGILGYIGLMIWGYYS